MDNFKTELVIFDLDGLLINSESVALRSTLKAAESVGVPLSEKCARSTIGMTEQASLELYSNALPEYRNRMEDVMTLMKMIFSEAMENGEIEAKPGARELLEYLRRRKIKCVLATSSSRTYAEKCLSVTGLKEYFGDMLTGDDISRSKPDPQIFLKAASRFECNPPNAVVLEDSKNGLSAAVNGGFRCILVPDIAEIPPEDEKLAWVKIDSLYEVLSRGLL